MSAYEYAQSGLIVAKLMLGLTKAIGLTFLKTKVYGSSSDLALLCAAIFLGQAEGKPMTAGKLSDFVGMPRSTVIRKLTQLAREGMVESLPGNRWGIAMRTPEQRQIVNALIAENTSIIKKAAAQLSKLDT